MSKEMIASLLAKGTRLDGRKPEDFREVSVEYGVSTGAEGSARVKIGETEVLAGVKLELGTPYSDTPDQGALMVGAEFLPMASPEFELGPPRINSIELARIVDRGIRESHTVDMKKLCIEKNEKVWMVIIDVCTINDAGNLMDAAALAAIAALKDTKFPEIDGDHVDYKKKTTKKLPLNEAPVAITVFKIGKDIFVDPTVEEGKEYDARVTSAITEDGNLCAMQKGGEATLSADEIVKMVDLAIKKSKELRAKL
ncbi:exosome complex protein Rrp42 [Nanoarchaeota archaeon]